MDCKYDVLRGYVPSFIEHLEEARARLGVGAGPEASEEGMVIDNADGNEAAENSPAAPDTISPDTPSLSLWTSTEQTAFFRALSVYSRWRPDLVAACVPTKSVWEVGLYLEALEQGAARLAMEEEEDGDDDREDDDCRRSPREVAERNGKGKIKEQDDGNRDKDTDMDGSPSSSTSSGSDSDMDEAEDEDEDEDTLDPYRSHEPAHEVSEAWIDAEEVMASWVIHEDYLASLDKHAGNDVDAGELEGVEHEPPKRKRGRPRGSGKGRGRRRPPAGGKTEADSRSQSMPPLVQHSQTPERTHDLSTGPGSSSGSRKRTLDSSDSPTRKRSKLDERETLMGRLEDAHLLVLDGILREDEEAMRERNKSREGSVAEVRTHVAKDRNEGGLGSGDVVGVGASDERQVDQGDKERTGACPSNAMIDPVLLALSGVTSGSAPTVPPAPTLDLPYEPSKPAPPANTSSQPIPSHQSPSTLLQLGASNMLTCPNTSNVVVPNPDPTRDPDPMLLSPRSRRRLQKRLYMRRRRALLHGDNVGSESALSTADKSKATNMEKLKPGKKAKAEQSDMPVAFASVPGSEAPSDVESEAAKEISTKTKGGLTLPYKLKAEFAALGVDAAYLRAQGMDLLHLGVLGRLMG
ncbi:hypothetical protein PAXINDRAFT_103124 [Paxillus involutus ATCC 200175]|uniref:Uncharacterized protein n=1 Tax=Paxillus involutus ATCC 200175 TaxID=664439 RepID=A0A0C9TG60_PAXIN|nr:hypothetical protein PAXINDRAFT_103124 [Paxillus involutus ATCC 200175]